MRFLFTVWFGLGLLAWLYSMEPGTAFWIAVLFKIPLFAWASFVYDRLEKR